MSDVFLIEFSRYTATASLRLSISSGSNGSEYKISISLSKFSNNEKELKNLADFWSKVALRISNISIFCSKGHSILTSVSSNF